MEESDRPRSAQQIGLGEVFIMRKAPIEKRHRGNRSAHASTVVGGSNSGPSTKVSHDSDARRALGEKTLVETVKTLGELRRKAGITGAATIVGFVLCLHAGHAQRPAMSLILMLLAVAVFTLIMILLQWFERWTKDQAT